MAWIGRIFESVLEPVTKRLDGVESRLKFLEDEVKLLRRLVARSFVIPPQRPPAVRSVGEKGDRMEYQRKVSQLTPEEIVQVNEGELVKQIFTDPDGTENEVDLEQAKVGEVILPGTFLVKKGETFTVTLHNVDDDGNLSAKVPLTMVAKDDIPPATPGAPSLVSVSEKEPV